MVFFVMREAERKSLGCIIDISKKASMANSDRHNVVVEQFVVEPEEIAHHDLRNKRQPIFQVAALGLSVGTTICSGRRMFALTSKLADTAHMMALVLAELSEECREVWELVWFVRGTCGRGPEPGRK